MNSSDTNRAPIAAAKTTSQDTTTDTLTASVADITNTVRLNRWQPVDTLIIATIIAVVLALWLA